MIRGPTDDVRTRNTSVFELPPPDSKELPHEHGRGNGVRPLNFRFLSLPFAVKRLHQQSQSNRRNIE
jgi:hypothetical protein